MKKYKGIDLIVSGAVLILVIALAAVLGILKVVGTLKTDVSAFLIIMTTITLGMGVYLTIFAVLKRGGYEFGIGGFLLTIGVILLLVCLKVYWVVILIVGLALAACSFVGMFLIKAPRLEFVTTDKEENFVPHMEKLAKEKEQEKEDEEPLPEIKSFKD